MKCWNYWGSRYSFLHVQFFLLFPSTEPTNHVNVGNLYLNKITSEIKTEQEKSEGKPEILKFLVQTRYYYCWCYYYYLWVNRGKKSFLHQPWTISLLVTYYSLKRLRTEQDRRILRGILFMKTWQKWAAAQQFLQFPTLATEPLQTWHTVLHGRLVSQKAHAALRNWSHENYQYQRSNIFPLPREISISYPCPSI